VNEQQGASSPKFLFHNSVRERPGYTAFWTLLRRARLCPNCEAIFDSSFTYCPSCGAQHAFDTISLLQVMNQAELRVDKYGETHSVKPKTPPIRKAYDDEMLRASLMEQGPGETPYFYDAFAWKRPGSLSLLWLQFSDAVGDLLKVAVFVLDKLNIWASLTERLRGIGKTAEKELPKIEGTEHKKISGATENDITSDQSSVE